MIYSVSAAPSSLPPTTPQGMVASVIASAQPALARQTAASISGTVNYADLRNDTRQGSGFASSAAQAAAPGATASAASAEDSTAPYFASGRITGFPSLFLVQVIGQGDGGAEGLLTVYEALMAMADVKYKPSDAGKPSAPTPGLDFLKSLGTTQVAPANQNPAPTQAANSNQLSFAFMNNGEAVKKPSQNGVPVALAAKTLPPSLARTRGPEAYSFSLQRADVFVAEEAELPKTLVA